jgi:solute carrier family 25 iron transporter 28/37
MTLKEIVAGGIAGVGEHLGMFPFDTIKTRMQVSHTSFVATVSNMIRNERWTHMYRGCVPVLFSAVPAHGAYFSIYEAAKRRLSGSADSIGAVVISAACATVAHDAVSVPFDVVKQQMQIDSTGKHTSSLQCLRYIVRTRGPTALFSSLPTTIAMNIPHVATHWVAYETVKASLHFEQDDDIFNWKCIVAGLVAGTFAATASTPFDNIKTQLQVCGHLTPSSAASSLYKHGGWRTFFTGLGPRVAYMAPSAAIVMTTYESGKSLLNFLD